MNSLIESFFQQTITGQIICLIVIFSFIVYLLLETYKMRWLSNLHKDLYSTKSNDRFNDSKNKNMPGNDEPEDASTDEVYSSTSYQIDSKRSSFFNRVLSQFITIKIKNPDVADLDSIMDKEMPATIGLADKTIKFLPNLMVSLGLLGTFIGLSSSIGLLIKAFSGDVVQTTEDLKAFSQFMDVIRSPLASMSTAFVTSITGLIFSLAATLLHNLFFSARESMIFGEMIDYCENVVGARYENKLDRAILVLRDGMKDSIDLFSENVRHLSLDLSTSVTTIHESMIGLNGAIEGLSVPINSFRSSIDSFNQSCSTLDQQVSTINHISEELSMVIGTTMKNGIENFVFQMGNVTDKFSSEMDVASQNLGTSMAAGVSGITIMLTEVENTLKESTESHNAMNQSLTKLDSIHGEYLDEVKNVNSMMDATKKLLLETEYSIKEISSTVVQGISLSFQSSGRQMSNDMVAVLQESMAAIMNDTQNIVIETRETIMQLRQELLPAVGNINIELNNLVASINNGNVDLQKKTIENLKEMSAMLNNSYNRYQSSVKEFHDLSNVLTQAIGTLCATQVQYESYSN